MTQLRAAPAEMILKLAPEEWIPRYVKRFAELLIEGDSSISQSEAEVMAQADFDACDLDDVYDGYENDPEGSAQESASYYD